MKKIIISAFAFIVLASCAKKDVNPDKPQWRINDKAVFGNIGIKDYSPPLTITAIAPAYLNGDHKVQNFYTVTDQAGMWWYNVSANQLKKP